MAGNLGRVGGTRVAETMNRISARFEEISARTGLRFQTVFQDAVMQTETESAGPQAVMADAAGISTSETQSLVERIAREYGLDPALALAVAKAESNFNAAAVSTAGAVGVMQLMPGTAQGLGVENSYNVLQNVDGGVRYLQAQLNTFDGDVKKALAAYNWGPGSLLKNGITDLNSAAQYAKLPAETQNYIRRVLQYYEKYVGQAL